LLNKPIYTNNEYVHQKLNEYNNIKGLYLKNILIAFYKCNHDSILPSTMNIVIVTEKLLIKKCLNFLKMLVQKILSCCYTTI